MMPHKPDSDRNFADLFIRGLAYPWRGLGFIVGHPGLWHLTVWPFFLSLAVYVGVNFLGWHFMGEWLSDQFFGERAIGWRILGVLIAIVYWAAALVISAIAFIPLASVLASPFNDRLSERTEQIYRGASTEEAFTLRGLWRGIKVGVASEIARLATVLVLLAAFFPLNFVTPFGNLAYAVISASITIYYLGLEFTSFSMDRRYFDWSRKREFLSRYRPRTIGFGAMSFVFMMVPLVNALFIPILAVAGTLLFCDTELERGTRDDPPPLGRRGSQ